MFRSAIFFVVTYFVIQIFADYSPFGYLHDASRGCETEYEYSYKNMQVPYKRFHPYMHIRTDPENSNALLFRFTKSNKLTPFPVRVFYNNNGKINKTQFHTNETDFSAATKKAIILTTQIDYEKVRFAIDENGPKNFKTLVNGKTKNCNISVDITDYGNSQILLKAKRNFTECTGTEKYADYPKYKESTKEWEMYFKEKMSTNVLFMFINIKDYFPPDKVVTIKSSLTYRGCKEISDVLDTTGVVEERLDLIE